MTKLTPPKDPNLVAAAPDLLDALECLLSYLEGYDHDYPEAAPKFNRARAAIAKAQGVQKNIEDWKVELVDTNHYAIFHKVWNLEWTDEQGNNLCFETAQEARQYLKEVFKEESHDSQ
jgi:hypothetical protein